VIDGLGGIPCGSRHLLDGQQQVGQQVLDGLELTDGPTELDARFGVFGGHLKAGPGSAGDLRRNRGEHDGVDQVTWRLVENGIDGDRHARKLDGRDASRRVDAGLLGNRHAGDTEVDQTQSIALFKRDDGEHMGRGGGVE
jgi:hypothetical protein